MLLEGLETLCLLASEGTMAKVASRLYISQSAVSKRIAQLEQRLGKKLIEPDGRHIRLTPQARELLARVAPSLAEMKGVLADSQTLTDQTPLSIACSETLLAGYLARFMHAYLERDPHIAPLYPPHPGHSGPGARRGCPARDLRRSPAAGPWAVCRTAAGGALLSGGGRSG